MTGKLHIKVVTVERVLYDSQVDELSLPTAEGMITILPGHVPLVSLVVPGEMRVKVGGENIFLATSRGVMIIKPGSEVVLMADTIEHAEEIDIERAEQARRRAEEMMQKKDTISDVDFARFAGLLERNLNRVKIGNRRLSRSGGR